MGVFRQLGDPVGVGVCLCQHHGIAYAWLTPPAVTSSKTLHKDTIDQDTPIVQVQIVTTETCCIVVNAALMDSSTTLHTDVEIERPIGSIKTQQEDELQSNQVKLFHYATWEVLPAGTYTYYLMNRAGHALYPYAAWIKAIASDCEG